jgi:uncharacterized protein (DUF4415 family)
MTRTNEHMSAFERDLLESIAQAKRGEFAMVHTPEMIAARRVGRPLGSVKASPKQPTTLRLDPNTLANWRATGKGWQTRAAQVLESYAKKNLPATATGVS